MDLEAGVTTTRSFRMLTTTGAAANITSCTVRAALKYGSAAPITTTCAVTDAANGLVSATFNLPANAALGVWALRFLVTDGQGVTTRYPDGAPLTLTVWERI